MKRFPLSFVSGVLELASAATPLLIAWSLPGSGEIARTFGSAREMAQVSGQHIQGLENQITSVRDGAAGIHAAMQQFSRAMMTLESVRYPVITLNRLTPSVVWKSFLPEGAGGQARNIAKATQAGVHEVDRLKQDLPRIRGSLQEMDSVLAQYSQRTAASLWYGRLLMGLVAVTIGLHGTHLILPILLPRIWNWLCKATPSASL